MKPASPGVRFALWMNENEGSDLNHQGRIRVAKKVNAMVKQEVMKERRRCAELCERHAGNADAMGGDWSNCANGIRSVRSAIIKGDVP